MKYILILIAIFSFPILGQNFTYELVSVDSLEDSIYFDLGVDTDELQSSYGGGDEYRLIGLLFSGTWTNDTMVVKAAITEDGTYYTVQGEDGTDVIVLMGSNTWVWTKPIEWAGIRYVLFTMYEAEADSRSLYLIKRQY